MHLPPADELLLDLQTAALIGLCFRIWRTGLHRTYVYFFSYLVVVLFESTIPIVFPYGTVSYGYVWMAAEAVNLVLYTLIVLECYTSVLRGLGGIATVSRRYIKITVMAALMVAVLLLGIERTPRTVFQYFYALDRTVVSSLLMFVLLMLVFLVYYPVPLSRNVIVYSMGYALYFVVKTAGLFVRNIDAQLQLQVSALLLGGSTACLMFWLIALNRQGETKTLVIGHQWHPEDEERLLSQLRAINAGLKRSVRK